MPDRYSTRVQPEVLAVASSGLTGVHIGEVATGRTITGRYMSNDERSDKAKSAVLDIAGMAFGATFELEGTETYYRAMSEADAETLFRTGKVTGTTETMTSGTAAFSNDYRGVLVKFEMKSGTTAELEAVGVRDQSKVTGANFPDMPVVDGEWNTSSAYFKKEGDQVNIGLGRGNALDIFNSKIKSISVLRW